MNAPLRPDLGHPLAGHSGLEVINGVALERADSGSISYHSLASLIACRLGLPANTPHNVVLERFRLAVPAGVSLRPHGSALRGLPRTSAANRIAVAEWLGLPPDLLWPDLREEQQPELSQEQAEPLLNTARALRIAVDALPVGRDIRVRLLAHIDAHIAAIEALQ